MTFNASKVHRIRSVFVRGENLLWLCVRENTHRIINTNERKTTKILVVIYKWSEQRTRVRTFVRAHSDAINRTTIHKWNAEQFFFIFVFSPGSPESDVEARSRLSVVLCVPVRSPLSSSSPLSVAYGNVISATMRTAAHTTYGKKNVHRIFFETMAHTHTRVTSDENTASR